MPSLPLSSNQLVDDVRRYVFAMALVAAALDKRCCCDCAVAAVAVECMQSLFCCVRTLSLEDTNFACCGRSAQQI